MSRVSTPMRPKEIARFAAYLAGAFGLLVGFVCRLPQSGSGVMLLPLLVGLAPLAYWSVKRFVATRAAWVVAAAGFLIAAALTGWIAVIAVERFGDGSVGDGLRQMAGVATPVLVAPVLVATVVFAVMVERAERAARRAADHAARPR